MQIKARFDLGHRQGGRVPCRDPRNRDAKRLSATYAEFLNPNRFVGSGILCRVLAPFGSSEIDNQSHRRLRHRHVHGAQEDHWHYPDGRFGSHNCGASIAFSGRAIGGCNLWASSIARAHAPPIRGFVALQAWPIFSDYHQLMQLRSEAKFKIEYSTDGRPLMCTLWYMPLGINAGSSIWSSFCGFNFKTRAATKPRVNLMQLALHFRQKLMPYFIIWLSSIQYRYT